MGWPFGNAPGNGVEREEKLRQSLVPISSYINEIDAWAEGFGQKPFWFVYETDAESAKKTFTKGIPKGGPSFDTTASITSPNGLPNVLLGIGLNQIERGRGWSYRGGSAAVVVLLTGRNFRTSVKGLPATRQAQEFLSERALMYGDEFLSLPPKYVLGAFIPRPDGAMGFLKNEYFGG